ncbi:MAG TPA: hypothetical protein VGN20_03995 [Mucilaginibacter sp.]|jgi:hypothetical protein
MEVIRIISQRVGDILDYYFGSDMDVMSDDAKKIFSNKEDRQKYIDAVEELRKENKKEVEITLSNKETVTLIS